MFRLFVSESLVVLRHFVNGHRSTPTKLFFLLFTVAIVASSVFAQVGVKTDRGAYPEGTAPALPSAGGKIIDPVFGTEMLRVTDERDGANFGTAYAYWPTFNSNSTRLLVQDDDGPSLLCTFDPNTFQIGSKERLVYPPGSGLTTDEDAFWSALDPDILFIHRGAIIWAYNVRTKSYSEVGDMSAYFPAGAYLLQMTVSRDDDTFAFTVRNSDYSVRGYAVWRDSANSVIHYTETQQLDEVQIDKTGRYLGVKTGLQGAGKIQARIVDLNTQTVTDLTDNAPGFAPGHGDYGMGTVVAYDNWTNRLSIRNLASPLSINTALSFGDDWLIDMHFSLLADDERWGLMSVYNSGPVYERELVMVATDGSQRVRRFAHHYSRLVDYNDSPRANLSRDGRFAAFTSNWGGRSRRDLFIAKVPLDGTAPAPSPSPSPSPTPTVTPTPTPTVSPSPSPTPAPEPAPIPEAGPSVTWQIVQGTQALGSTVWHTGALTNGMARSTQVISTNSYFEWTYSPTAGRVWAGLGNHYDEGAATGPNDLPYCFDGGVIKELGATKKTLTLVEGDVLRIEINRKGTVIYKRNGVAVYQSKVRSIGFFYLVFKSRNVVGTKISNARVDGINYGK